MCEHLKRYKIWCILYQIHLGCYTFEFIWLFGWNMRRDSIVPQDDALTNWIILLFLHPAQATYITYGRKLKVGYKGNSIMHRFWVSNSKHKTPTYFGQFLLPLPSGDDLYQYCVIWTIHTLCYMQHIFLFSKQIVIILSYCL